MLAANHGLVIPFDAVIDALSKFRDYDADRAGEQLREMEEAELITVHPGGDIELLARGDLWTLPEDVDPNN
jgi:hypothetical protein